MAKQGKGFARTGDIDVYLKHARRMVDAVDWPNADKQEFAVGAAKVFALVNQAHPFREGNGRTSKILMTQLAETSRFSLDFGAVSRSGGTRRPRPRRRRSPRPSRTGRRSCPCSR